MQRDILQLLYADDIALAGRTMEMKHHEVLELEGSDSRKRIES
jgi:hypothetical protein